jgi:L-aminopeptidase/D-esterase-like protein
MSAPAFRIGHYTDRDALTGCTVILFDHPLPTAVDARGGAPGTRETDLLAPGALVQVADAILLTGGSAFGLGAAQGVMTFLAEHGRGVSTSAGAVPIVPAAVVFDLAKGKPIWPTPDDALAASRSAVRPEIAEIGRVGAGVGTTMGKLAGSARPGGFGIGRQSVDDIDVWALAVVNAAGSIGGDDSRPSLLRSLGPMDQRSSTTLIAVVIAGSVDDRTRRRCAVSAHDGMARCIRPCHTIWDGDVAFVSSEPGVDTAITDVARFSIATELAVEAAIVAAVQ